MKLTLFNETREPFLIGVQSPGITREPDGQPRVAARVLPHTSTTITAPEACNGLHIEQCGSEKEELGLSNGLTATIPLKLGAKWKSVRVPSDGPWRIYRSKVCRMHVDLFSTVNNGGWDDQISKGCYRLSVFERRDMASFLSQMPDSLPLSSLLLPGTHDTYVHQT